MSEETQQAIAALQRGNTTEFKSSIEELLASKAMAAIDAERVTAGANMFADEEVIDDEEV